MWDNTTVSEQSKTVFGLCMTNRAGWKSVRARFERFLPDLGGEWTFVHLENHLEWVSHLTNRLGKFQMIYDVLAGRAAAQEAIQRGATRILFGTYHNCPWLPNKAGVRYFIFMDATMRQLIGLGQYSASTELSRVANWIYGEGVRRQAEAGHHFFCMSNWNAAGLQAEHGVPPDQITIIPPFVDTGYWTPRTGPRQSGPLRVVFTGADFLRKGGDIVLEVAAMPEFSALRWQLVTKSPPATTAANITCHTGFNADATGLRDLVQASDLMVLPTRADCSPNVLIEAAASGIPAIATRMAGIPDLVEDGATGFLLEKPDAEHLAAALRKYVAAPGLIQTHGNAAREKAVREFDFHGVMAKIKAAMSA